MHAEHGDGVAARVDRVEQAVAAVVGQRALRGEVVDDRTGQHAAVAAGRVDAGLLQDAARRPVVGDDGVTGGLSVWTKTAAPRWCAGAGPGEADAAVAASTVAARASPPTLARRAVVCMILPKAIRLPDEGSASAWPRVLTWRDGSGRFVSRFVRTSGD